jgi:DNA-binding GntR family transcriptional regulator
MKSGNNGHENTVVGKIANSIRHGITTAIYAPGTHLKESKISSEFGVSRVPVREAFRLLQSEGYLDVIPNRGSFVRPISLNYIKQTSIVYKLLAPVILEKAIPNYKASTYKKAYAILEKIDNTEDFTNIGFLLWDFAKVIYGPSKYDFILCIFDEIYSHSTRLLYEFFKSAETKKYKVETQYKFLELCKEGKKNEAIKLWSDFIGTLSQEAVVIAEGK